MNRTYGTCPRPLAIVALAISLLAVAPIVRADDLYLPQPAALALTQDLLDATPESKMAASVQTLVTTDVIIGGAANFAGKLSPLSWVAICIYDAWEAGWTGDNLSMYYVCRDPNVNVVDFSTWYGVPFAAHPIYYSNMTLIKEVHNPAVYVVVGHAPLYVNTGAYFNNNWGSIVNLEDGRIAKMSKVPVTGTLVREWHAQEVYEIIGGWKCHIMNQSALYRVNPAGWWAVQVVPDNSLSNIPYGWNIN